MDVDALTPDSVGFLSYLGLGGGGGGGELDFVLCCRDV